MEDPNLYKKLKEILLDDYYKLLDKYNYNNLR